MSEVTAVVKQSFNAAVAVKAAVRERDGQKCTECGLTAKKHIAKYGKTLDVHRIMPGHRYTLENCVTLCRDCHYGKPKKPAGAEDEVSGIKKKDGSFVRVRSIFIDGLKELSKRNVCDITKLVNTAVRKELERDGLWPVKE